MWLDGAPHDCALVHRDGDLDYAGLDRHVGRVAARLQHVPGLAAVRATNDCATVGVVLAALKIGRPLALLPRAIAPAELGAIRALLGRCVEVDGNADVIFTATGDERLVDPQCALIVLTSGSTGTPRAVQLSYRQIDQAAVNCIGQIGFDRGIDQQLFVPLSHVFGLVCQLLPALRAGVTTHLVDGFAEMSLLVKRGLARGAISGVPSHWEAILRFCSVDPALDARVERLVSSGATLTSSLRKRLAERFPGAKIINGYGLSEAPRILALTSDHPRFLSETTGVPTVGATLAIGPDGDLRVRGDLVTPGYLGDSAATSRIRDGWLNTGDIAEVQADGSFRILGRGDDMRKIGGELISLDEVDRGLCLLPGVIEAAAATEASDVYGEQLIAFLVAPDEFGRYRVAELRRTLATMMSWHKVPRRFFLTAALPRGATGKLQRRRLLNLATVSYEMS